jgi:hypothetical protein
VPTIKFSFPTHFKKASSDVFFFLQYAERAVAKLETKTTPEFVSPILAGSPPEITTTSDMLAAGRLAFPLVLTPSKKVSGWFLDPRIEYSPVRLSITLPAFKTKTLISLRGERKAVIVSA